MKKSWGKVEEELSHITISFSKSLAMQGAQGWLQHSCHPYLIESEKDNHLVTRVQGDLAVYRDTPLNLQKNKNVSMSKAQLKKHLLQLTKEQVIDVVLELYDARKEAKEYLDFYINPNDDIKLEEYKKIIYNEFYPSRGEPKCRFSVCRKAISDFKKLKPSPSCIADLMLFYIETGVNFTVEYGDMWEQYYTALENNFDKAMEFIYKNGYLEDLRPRIEKMLKNSENCGWGFPDTLYDFYYQH